jgi:nucleolar MIF4G domain-containing protein 1
LKPLSFQYLKPKTKTFIEIMIVTVILESQKRAKEGRNEKGLLNIFINVDTAPEMIAGMQFFLKKVVRKSELTANKAEKETVQWACKAVGEMLTRLMATVAMEED